MKLQNVLKAGSLKSDERIYAEVFDAILSHRLPPGTKLSEESLGRIFGVSRTLIRKTLQRLAYEGVVLIRPNRGASIVHTSVQDARQVFEARKVLEGVIVKIAAKKISSKSLAALRKHCKEEADTYENGDRGSAVRLSGVFHLLLAECTENEMLCGFMRILVSRSSLVISEYEHTQSNTHCDHIGLIEAIENRDGDKAEQLMIQHLDMVENNLNYDKKSSEIDLEQIFNK
ncbi:MAG: GntR family transcriptional regulator [Gammaproteobacteria bacterium]|nr:GntR family transcriptional regulator [Gammaproteobacteria bacterium]